MYAHNLIERRSLGKDFICVRLWLG